jgi:hypothetical protein
MSADLVFKSFKPFYLRHALKLIIGSLVNITAYTKELYEEIFTNIFPCYVVSYKMRRI